MLEIPCTLRCDECKETQSAIMPAKARYTSFASQGLGRTLATFTIEDDALPHGWSLTAGPKDKLRCPRCNGVK